MGTLCDCEVFHMSRKEELLEILKSAPKDKLKIIEKLIDDVIFLEEILDNLMKLPFIKVNTKNPALQKRTEASKMYKEQLQQYNNCIKILLSILGDEQTTEDSVFRKWIQKRSEEVKNE